jgi:hypothetical protein
MDFRELVQLLASTAWTSRQLTSELSAVRRMALASVSWCRRRAAERFALLATR